MKFHAFVDDRNRAVRGGFKIFLLGACTFVTSCSLTFVVSFGGASLISQYSLEFILWSLAFIMAITMIQLMRLSSDGQKLAHPQGAQPADDCVRDIRDRKIGGS